MTSDFWMPLALLAMVVRVEHPLDCGNTNLQQSIQYKAVTNINQDGRRPILNHVDVAGVEPHKHVRGDGFELHGVHLFTQ